MPKLKKYNRQLINKNKHTYVRKIKRLFTERIGGN